MKFDPDNVKYDDKNLIPAIVQDANTREVLTLAYMNRESLTRTLATGETWFWSRSRSELWHKGATSGNTQRVIDLRLDCDADALVVLVEPKGPACHTGDVSCFGAESGNDDATRDLGATLEELYAVLKQRRFELPENSYTTYLFVQGLDKILKKIGEEAAETIIAAKNPESSALISETSDLLYHLLVLLVARDIPLDDVRRELAERRRHEK